MSTFNFSLRAVALAAALLAPVLAGATNGYFSHGYGAKSQGMAGVGIALPQDALAAATNPAGTAAVGNRYDLGLTLFAPSRDASIIGNDFGADASYSGNNTSTSTSTFRWRWCGVWRLREYTDFSMADAFHAGDF